MCRLCLPFPQQQICFIFVLFLTWNALKFVRGEVGVEGGREEEGEGDADLSLCSVHVEVMHAEGGEREEETLASQPLSF